MWRRVCREAGGRLLSGYLRDLSLGGVAPTDDRRLECVITGLSLHNGAQLAVDTTLVSPLKRNGDPRPRASWENGAALADARKRKEKRYPELRGTRCRLVVTAMEVGGRWSNEAHDFLEALAAAKAQDAPVLLRGSSCRHWMRRWNAFLAVAGMRAFANTLLYGTASNTEVLEGATPQLGQFLGLEHDLKKPGVSRLGPR